MKWTKLEKKMALDLMSGLMPEKKNIRNFHSFDLETFWQIFELRSPKSVNYGFRFCVWFLYFLPMVFIGASYPVRNMPQDKKNYYFSRISTSRSFFIRQLVNLLKIMSSLAYFHDEKNRKEFM